MKKRFVTVNDKMQKGYRYELVAPMGKNFDPEFKPQLTPKQMLALGVFGGRYMTDCRNEFPEDWFAKAKLAEPVRKGVPTNDAKKRRDWHDKSLNLFNINASQSLGEWKRKGWIHKDDPRGWFQWYCRYYMGRRIPAEDARQIKRWKAIRRHVAQVMHSCTPGDPFCRRRQKQAILHWAYDSRRL